MLTLLKNALKFISVLLLFMALGKVLFLALNPSLAPLLLSFDTWSSLIWGLRLDLSAAAILALLTIITYAVETAFSKRTFVTRSVLWAGLIWCVVTTMVDGIYMTDVGRHITFEVFTGSGLEDGLLMTALTQYPWHVLLGVALMLISGYCAMRIPLQQPTPNASPRAWMEAMCFWLVWLALSVTVVRGGWQDVPQSPMSAYRIGSPEQAKVAWNAPYAIGYYLIKGKKRAAHKMTPPPSAAEVSSLQHMLSPRPVEQSKLRQANLVLVLLESWTAVDLFSYAARADSANFFDSLRQRSLTTTSMYADGHRTVEGMFSIFCSFPNPVGGGVAGTQLQGLPYRCLPQLLREAGWDTRFIQGSGRGIVGAFAQSLGFERSYGKGDFDFDGVFNHWGYMDDDIYRFALKEITNAQPPFFVSINTGTTHDTFLPNASDYVFGQDDPTAIRQAVTRHADQALARFIRQLLEQLTQPTLIVLVADHTKTANAPGLEGNAIPFLAFSSDDSLPPIHRNIVASQRDIAPTIMDWLGGFIPWFTGASLLNNDYLGHASFSSGSQVTWIEGHHLARFDAAQPAAEAICLNLDPSGLNGTSSECNPLILARGIAHTRYTQELLFRGCTQDYGQPPSEDVHELSESCIALQAPLSKGSESR